MTQPVLEAHALERRFGSNLDSFVLHLDALTILPGACVAVTGPVWLR